MADIYFPLRGSGTAQAMTKGCFLFSSLFHRRKRRSPFPSGKATLRVTWLRREQSPRPTVIRLLCGTVRTVSCGSTKNGGCKKKALRQEASFLYAVFKFYFGIRCYGIFRKFRKKLRDFFRVLQKGKFFCLFKALYTVFQFSSGGFAIAKPKTGNAAYLVTFCIFCRRFKPVIMGINPALYIICKAGIKGIIPAQKGIYPKHQISRTARTFPSSLASPTTNPAFLKSLFARLFSREYAAQSFFASPRGYSFTILIASCSAAVP